MIKTIFNFQNQPDKHCFCQNVPGNGCPPKGTIDLMPCVASPIYGLTFIELKNDLWDCSIVILGSKPHFLDADEELLQNIEGLMPNRSAHDIFVNFEAVSNEL